MELVKRLENSPQIVRGAKVKALTTACLIFTSKSKQKAPRATGNLGRNIKYHVATDGNQAEVYNKLDYALYQEEGTGIYGKHGSPIVPKRAKALRFKSRSGKIIFAKSVRGTKGKWFMRSGSEETNRQTGKIDQTLFTELKKGLQ